MNFKKIFTMVASVLVLATTALPTFAADTQMPSNPNVGYEYIMITPEDETNLESVVRHEISEGGFTPVFIRLTEEQSSKRDIVGRLDRYLTPDDYHLTEIGGEIAYTVDPAKVALAFRQLERDAALNQAERGICLFHDYEKTEEHTPQKLWEHGKTICFKTYQTTTYTCTKCGKEKDETEVIKTENHIWVNDRCERCGYRR